MLAGDAGERAPCRAVVRGYAPPTARGWGYAPAHPYLTVSVPSMPPSRWPGTVQ